MADTKKITQLTDADLPLTGNEYFELVQDSESRKAQISALPPIGASYLMATSIGALTHSRVLTAGIGISFVDNGAGSTFVVSADYSALSLGDLSDVNIPAPTDNQVLTFDSGTNTWVAADPAAATSFGDNWNWSTTPTAISFTPPSIGTGYLDIALSGSDVGVILRAQGISSIDLAAGGSTRLQVLSTGGLLAGSPTGGDQGAGTINATGLFVHGVAVGLSGGSVTSVTAGTGLTATPNPIVTTGTISVNQAASLTWTGLQTFGGSFAYGVTSNGSATGANATLNAHPTPYVRMTNGGLTSLAKINTAGVSSGHVVIVNNSTGADITITDNYDVSGEQIRTGYGASVILPANGSAYFVYDGTGLHWNMMATQVPSANPSASIGLTANNGTAKTFMRSDGSPALSQAITPTWTGKHIHSAQIQLSGPAAYFIADASQGFIVDNAADTRNLLSIANNGNTTFGNATDNPTYTFSGTGAISGNGSGLTSLNASNVSSGTVADARLSSNVPLLNAASNTFTGTVTASQLTLTKNYGSTPGALLLTSSSPCIEWLETDVATDSQRWYQYANAATMNFGAIDSTQHNYLQASRSGVAISSLTFGNSADNPTYTFSGTGAITGVGSGLTALNASNVSSGTLADARLSSNVPLLNAASNTFTVSTNPGLIVTGSTSYVAADRTTTSSGEVGVILSSASAVDWYIYEPVGSNTLSFYSLGNIRASLTPSGVFNATSDVQVNGTSVTNASLLASGTVADARLSSNVPLLNASNSFTQSLATGTNRQQIQNTDTTANSNADLRVTASSGSDAFFGVSNPGSSTVWTGGASGANNYLGTNSAVNISIGTNSTERVRIAGDGSLINLKATAIQGNSVDMTPSSGSFTGTFTGFSTGQTGTVYWYKIGPRVTMMLPSIAATSNATTMTMTGVPAAIQPSTGGSGVLSGQDNGSLRLLGWGLNGGTITFSNTDSSGVLSSIGFTASGQKGVDPTSALTYITT